MTGSKPIERPSGDEKNDLWNAEQLVARHGARFRYTPGWGWLDYDSARWDRDRLGHIHEAAGETVRAMAFQAATIENNEARAYFLKHIIQSGNHGKLLAMVERAAFEPAVKALESAFDRDPMAFNVSNGTLDLTTETLRPHCPCDLLTKLAPVRYDPDATAPAWDRFLWSTFAGRAEVIAFVQRAAGYSLTASTSEQVMFLLHGSGSNGKGVFLDTLRLVFGDYCKTAKTDTLMAKAHDNGQTDDLAGLVGARLLLAAESEQGTRLNESLIKQLTGQDTIRVRELYRPFFEMTPTFKIWFATNHKPTIRGADYAIWRRLLLIPFTERFVKPGDPRRPEDHVGVPDLREQLAALRSGVFNWCLDGLREYRRIGLAPPAEVVTATAAYQNEQDVIALFLREECIFGPTVEDTPVAVIYNNYRGWAKDAGEREQSQRAFGQRLSERGFQQRKGTGGIRLWIGLTSKPR